MGVGTGQVPGNSSGSCAAWDASQHLSFHSCFQKRPPLPRRAGQECLQIVPHISQEVRLSPDGNQCCNSGESESSAYKHPLLFGRRSDMWEEGSNAPLSVSCVFGFMRNSFPMLEPVLKGRYYPHSTDEEGGQDSGSLTDLPEVAGLGSGAVWSAAPSHLGRPLLPPPCRTRTT